MFAVNAGRRAAATAVRSQGTKRTAATYGDVCVSPPMNKISFGEKVFHGVLLSIGIMGYPLYAISEVAKMKQVEYDALEIPEEWQDYDPNQKK